MDYSVLLCKATWSFLIGAYTHIMKLKLYTKQDKSFIVYSFVISELMANNDRRADANGSV